CLLAADLHANGERDVAPRLAAGENVVKPAFRVDREAGEPELQTRAGIDAELGLTAAVVAEAQVVQSESGDHVRDGRGPGLCRRAELIHAVRGEGEQVQLGKLRRADTGHVDILAAERVIGQVTTKPPGRRRGLPSAHALNVPPSVITITETSNRNTQPQSATKIHGAGGRRAAHSRRALPCPGRQESLPRRSLPTPNETWKSSKSVMSGIGRLNAPCR